MENILNKLDNLENRLQELKSLNYQKGRDEYYSITQLLERIIDRTYPEKDVAKGIKGNLYAVWVESKKTGIGKQEDYIRDIDLAIRVIGTIRDEYKLFGLNEASEAKKTMDENFYDTAQICLNGHVIHDATQWFPDKTQKFCKECGIQTIKECPSCKVSIRGYYHIVGDCYRDEGYIAPKFCHDCGKPYPWTESKLKAAQELIDEAEKLTDTEKIILKQSINDLVKGTPNTQVAALRFKKYAAKAGDVVLGALRDIVIDIVSEAVKKVLIPET